MPASIELLETRVVRLAGEVEQKLQAEFRQLVSEGASTEVLHNLGFASIRGELGPGGTAWPSASMKYVRVAGPHLRKFDRFLPYLIGLKSAFEIGVGPGYLFVILKELLGVNITGVDMRAHEQAVYRELRRGLGIDHLVQDHTVKAYQPIPITPGAEALIAFWTVFNHTWGVPEHEWFLAQAREKLSGPKLVIQRFNDLGYSDNPEVEAFYRGRGRFPFDDDRYFCIVEV